MADALTTMPAGADGTPADDARLSELAQRVIDLARGLVVADNPFLSPSIGLLETATAHLDTPFATDGKTLFVDARRVLEDFRRTREAPVHDLVHMLMHCLLLHPFVGSSVDADAWNLAADIVAESLAAEVAGPREGQRGAKIEAVLEQLADDLGPSGITTERLYRTLREGAYANARSQWEPVFRVDDHCLWPPSRAQEDASGSGGSAGQSQAGDGNSHAQSQELPQQTTAEASDAADAPDTSDTRDAKPPHGPADYRNGLADGSEGAEAADVPADASAPQDRDAELGNATEQQLAEAEQRWKQAAKSMRVDLETISRKRGAALGGLVRELEVGAHERVDYREFLRQFAVEHEDVRLSDDEFDYVFYTYGLELYKDMPLVEPLEYRNERRIRDFAIVIDTSSSVSAKVVQEFVDATFDVLTSEGGFFAKTNIHIIQADARVQSDVKITSVADLDRWRRGIKLQGFGGTDFRPAFRYVQELRQSGEFDDLQGLVYFTDGWGIYPERMPPYKCAFVFYDEDHRPELVPPWALQVVLHPGEFESLSVY